MRALLLSAYDAVSHQHWRRAVVEGLSDWDWQVLTQPPRHFTWRARGNALAWLREPILKQPYDLLLATSMVDLVGLKSLIPEISAVPACVYFHENQFAYPGRAQQQGQLELQIVSLYTALAADACLFNSRYNRDTFMAGAGDLLGRLPDGVPAGLVETLQSKAEVLPVPVAKPPQLPSQSSAGPLQLAWNHRWEYDKGPEQLLAICMGLLEADCDFTLQVFGQQFRRHPKEFEELAERLLDVGRLGQFGPVENAAEYWQALSRCDVVLSTAQHDFQGLSIMEGVSLGATPLVPDGLAYPEWFDCDYRYASIEQAVTKLCSWADQKAAGQPLPHVELPQMHPDMLLPRYRECLTALVL